MRLLCACAYYLLNELITKTTANIQIAYNKQKAINTDFRPFSIDMLDCVNRIICIFINGMKFYAPSPIVCCSFSAHLSMLPNIIIIIYGFLLRRNDAYKYIVSYE